MVDDFRRLLQVELPARRSAFLWGARKTGKSTFLEAAFPDSLAYDFLKTDVALAFGARPALLREQLLARPAADLARPIILDEVQKVPGILDEVHWLIEHRGLRFVLCGSSARKLKRGRANLLGGRAWRFEMFPLVTAEFPATDQPQGQFDLLRALNHGLLPAHYLSSHPRRSLLLFGETHAPRLSILVSNEAEERVVRGVRVMPWRRFFQELWDGRIIG